MHAARQESVAPAQLPWPCAVWVVASASDLEGGRSCDLLPGNRIAHVGKGCFLRIHAGSGSDADLPREFAIGAAAQALGFGGKDSGGLEGLEAVDFRWSDERFHGEDQDLEPWMSPARMSRGNSKA